jgi:hypothetical protein
MKWKNIWKEEPPRNQEIFFMLGNGDVHHGMIFSEEKLRKCDFRSFMTKEDFRCDEDEVYNDRVIWWFPMPEEEE